MAQEQHGGQRYMNIKQKRYSEMTVLDQHSNHHCAQAGQISQGLYLLGYSDVPVYLLDIGTPTQAAWALIEGGVSAHADRIWHDLCHYVDQPETVLYWFITHKHYDHCGLLPYLVPLLSSVKVIASEETIEAWQSASTREMILKLNRQLIKNELPTCMKNHFLSWELLPTQSIAPYVPFQLGTNHTFQAIPAPGHAADQIIFYDTMRQRAFVGDALGEFDPSSGSWRPLIFDDYAAYLKTLEILSQYPVQEVILGHYGMISGEKAHHAAADAYEACKNLAAQFAWHAAHHITPELHAYQLHEYWKSTSASFVPAFLHLASMKRMATLMTASQSIDHGTNNHKTHTINASSHAIGTPV